jgi:hypothetical protein
MIGFRLARTIGGGNVAAIVPAREPIVETLTLEEQVRQRAYELYLRRGNESGSELDDWLQAEQEILSAQDQQVDEE